MCFQNFHSPEPWVPRTIWEPPNSDILVLPSASASKPRSNSRLEGGYICNLSSGPIQMEFNSTTWFTGPQALVSQTEVASMRVTAMCVSNDMEKSWTPRTFPFPPKKKNRFVQLFSPKLTSRARRRCCSSQLLQGNLVRLNGSAESVGTSEATST